MSKIQNVHTPGTWKSIPVEKWLFQKGKAPSEVFEEPFEGGVSYLNPDFLRGISDKKGYIYKTEAVKLNKGDILVLWDGSNAGEILKGENGALPSTMVKIQNLQTNRNFLYYALKNSEEKIKSGTKGSGIPHADKDIILKLGLIEPKDTQEQQKIAEILFTIDDAIEKTDRLIEKYKKVKIGLMEDLFTKGIDVNTGKPHTKFMDSELGRIPESWEEGSIGDFLKVIGGFAFKSIDEVDFGIKWLKIANVGVQKTKWDSICYLPSKYQSIYSDFIIKEGDIVLALTRPLLKKKFKISQVTGNDGISLLNQRVGKVKPYNIVNDFAYYLLNTSNVINLIDIEILGTDPPNISTLQIEEFNISVPKPEEQKEIVKILNEASDKIKREENYKEKLEKIKTGLMNDLLTGKVRVKY